MENQFQPSIIRDLIRYNIKVIFGNKFVYFLGGSFIFFLLITGISLFSSSIPDIASLYYQLLFPALLLIFFPTVYGIQNDEDVRILEILFSIPNYRFKVWMVRILIILLMVWLVIVLLAFLDYFILLRHNILLLSIQLMVPVTFFGTVGFLFSTIIRNGHGAAVVVIILAIIAWFMEIVSGELSITTWSVFFNPFDMPSDTSTVVWELAVVRNRTFLLVVSAVSVLWGLLNLQRREKFMR
ncbi:hypothetical protein [Marinilabilia salmonicolor]|jgi:hypothetical protein|uniref:ABC-2 type transport system permease protein n=1 Tax=Marinilabilia salmonicolor TaxID=989 RepID=A0A368VDT9_9BACT|nr:hypothetical protein [Marinilabilia salmonicolor]RCW38415.1 hypothetical protein DFO77_104173 [Marinilabilia salmonicolor]